MYSCVYFHLRLFSGTESRASLRLVAEDHVVGVAERGEVLLHRREHRRGAAHEDERVLAGRGQLRLDDVRGDVADAVAPGRVVRPVDHEVELEVRVALSGGLELLAAHDVALGLVAQHQRQLRGVRRAGRDVADQLQHGRDARAAGDHADGHVAVSDRRGGARGLVLAADHELAAALVLERPTGAADADLGARGEVLEVVAHHAGGVDLDHEVEVAHGIDGGGGRVLARHERGVLAGGRGADREVLADGQRQVCALGQLEAEQHRVQAHVGRDHVTLQRLRSKIERFGSTVSV